MRVLSLNSLRIIIYALLIRLLLHYFCQQLQLQQFQTANCRLWLFIYGTYYK